MKCEQMKLFTENIKVSSENPACKDTKTCSKCKNNLPTSYFGPSGGGTYLRAECKSCNNELGKVRKYLKSIHGQPPEGYECPICLCCKEQAEGRGGNSGAWVLDHDHSTEEFRGWLCHSCNRALGGFNDNIPRMKRAIKYIKGNLQN